MNRRILTGAAAAWMLSLGPAQAFDTYLQVSSADTPVPADATHGWVEVLGFSHGSDAPIAVGGVPGKMIPRSGVLQMAQDRICLLYTSPSPRDS